MRSLTFLFILLSFSLFGQKKDSSFYEKIVSTAKPLTSQIAQGDIEMFKNAAPAKKTWTYDKLKIYKDSLSAGVFILNSNFIMPSINKSESYSYFEYALVSNNKEYQYYYVVGVVVNTSEDNFKIENKFILTEDKDLATWWRTAFYFFESDLKKTMPKQFFYLDIPPPPPQNFLSQGE